MSLIEHSHAHHGGSTSNALVALQVLLLSLALMCGAAVSSSVLAGPLDLSKRHAGSLMAITNTFASIPGILGVYVSGLLKLQFGWEGAFFFCATVYFFATALYLGWARTSLS